MWEPSPERIARANLTKFIRDLREGRLSVGTPPGGAREVHDYPSLYAWSIDQPAEFWAAVWRFCGIIADRTASGPPAAGAGAAAKAEAPWSEVVRGIERMAPPDPELGPTWFPGARLNFAENLLRFRDDRIALVFWNENGRQRELTYADVYDEVARLAVALREHGIVAGDRVAGWMPNFPETVIAMLATASIGAIWSSCSPDFGVKGVLDRFGQIEPRILFIADGYRYGNKDFDCLQRAHEIVDQCPTVEKVVVVHYRGAEASIGTVPRAVHWAEFVGRTRLGNEDFEKPRRRRSDYEDTVGGGGHDTPDIEFERLPFDHPLYIMYSSGTTGLPKCMVHSAGGTLLQHLKELVLHTDLTRDDTIFYFTTCGWMMWNWLVSSLAVGATVVLYDGAPLSPRPNVLWRMAERERVSIFGTSAKYLAALQKSRVAPGDAFDIAPLKAVLSTGSPLASHSYDFVYEKIKADLCLSSISGGTDIISCFALGNPIGPVYRGELQVRGLGMKVETLDANGQPIRGEAGELSCLMPFPSMPVAFWGDPDGAKYRAAYFDRFPNVWAHGDWAEITNHDGVIIHGRSDATLNPGGVRIGTAEIYRQVEQLPEIAECLAIEQETGKDLRKDTRIVLFVRLQEGVSLDDGLRERIRTRIRENTSPHHVPKKIVQVADIPRTISGKITELAVREVVHGRPVSNREALANPAALDLFRELPELAQ